MEVLYLINETGDRDDAGARPILKPYCTAALSILRSRINMNKIRFA
ncbi:MAG: hypothetical protein LLG20_00705 [Acidobacteriales bacterium]|nr:hypothetical protein [Terriglobales bacterium]